MKESKFQPNKLEHDCVSEECKPLKKRGFSRLEKAADDELPTYSLKSLELNVCMASLLGTANQGKCSF